MLKFHAIVKASRIAVHNETMVRLSTRPFVKRALKWISGHSREFSRRETDGRYSPARLKALAELAVMLRCYIRFTGDIQSDAVRTIISTLARVERNDAFRRLPLHAPEEFVPVCDVYAALRAVGRDLAQQRDVLQRVIASGILDHTDRMPQGHMEVRLCVEAAGLQAEWSTSAPHQNVAPLPISILLDDGLAYTLTHTIMFLTDFGAHPERLGDCAPLRDRLAMLLVRYIRDRSYDLLAETLLCWDAARLGDTPLTDAGWTSLVAAQDRWGAFPPHAASVEPQTRSSRAYVRFFRHYHTTLLSVIAGTLHAKTQGERRPYVPTADAWHPVGGVAGVKRGDLKSLMTIAVPARDRSPTALSHRILASWIRGSKGIDSSIAALARNEKSVPLVRADMPATLKIIMCALLVHYRRSAPSLLRFCNTIARLLSDSFTLNDLALHEKRLALYAIGVLGRPARLRWREVMRSATRVTSSSRHEYVDDLLLHIECVTELGTRRVRVARRDQWLQDLLLGLGQHALLAYDCPRACRILRALNWLGFANGDNYEACLLYMLDRHVTRTVDCLWTVAELSSDHQWRLYGSLPKLNRESQLQ